MSNSPIISFESVSKVYGDSPEKALDAIHSGKGREDILSESGNNVALQDINLEVFESEVFVLMGLSGSGKSTAIRHINRLIEPSRGCIKVFGEDLAHCDRTKLQEFRRTKAAMVFQRFGLLPHRTVLENIVFGLKIKRISKEKRNVEGMAWVEKVGLSGYENALPKDLSGGMQQRLQIARNLVTGPRLVFMDEPTGGLDVSVQARLLDLMRGLVREMGLSAIIVTHDLAVVRLLADRLMVMKDGHVVETGLTDQVLDDPQHAYTQLLVSSVLRV